MSRIALPFSLLSLMFLGACQTASNSWSDWEGIPYSEAMLQWEAPAQSDLMARKISYSGSYQEQWFWPAGGIFLAKAGHAYHYREVPSPQEFGRMMSDWKKFEISAAGMKASDVEEARNKYGKFFFADLKNDEGEDCWLFLQGLPGKTPAGYVDTGKPGGLFSGYECGTTRQNREELLQFAQNYRLK
ncbi:hypothetical protein [Kiloniella laminariae]|uniref:hypothetical protein n=1 Tax=Kiloniella laminariae TaxID=454162 RepID=UPI00039A8A7C|nr:hypothetical protein [Kiloniella laminariae]